jgi:hypothetical protein
MPFTFSHPAAILPFKSLPGHKVSLTALALGSMAPDFEFFFRMSADTDISHTLKGIFLFNIPVALVVAFLSHAWVRDALINHLPEFLQRRFAGYKQFNWTAYFKQNWWTVIFSAFLGVVSHFLCDDFTHGYGYTARHIGLLSTTYQLLGHSVPGYHILQYLSSLVMGILLVKVALEMPERYKAVRQPFYLHYWGMVALVFLLTFSIRLLVNSRGLSMNDLIMSVIAAGLLGIIVASLSSRFSRW